MCRLNMANKCLELIESYSLRIGLISNAAKTSIWRPSGAISRSSLAVVVAEPGINVLGGFVSSDPTFRSNFVLK